MNFIEIKLAFDNDSEKSLEAKEDLVNFYIVRIDLKNTIKSK